MNITERHVRIAAFIGLIIIGLCGLHGFDSQAQMGNYSMMSTWEPRNIGTKAGLVASHDPGNASTVTLNGVGVSRLEDRARSIRTGNLLLQSETFATTWTTNKIQQFGATDATNTLGSGSFANTARVTDPLGGNTADFIQEDTTASSLHYVAQTSLAAPSQTFRYSCWIKDGGRTNLKLYIIDGDNSANTVNCFYNLSTGLVGASASSGTGSGAVGTMIESPSSSGWYLCTLTGKASTTGTSTILRIYIADSSPAITYNGNGTSGLFIWGASLVASDWTQVTGPTLAQGYQVTTTAPYSPPNIIQPTAAAQPLISRTDNAGNLLKYSEDITQTAWTATSATKTGAGELTFTAQNGQVIQNVATPSGVSFTYSFYARTNVPGNTALTILHLNSATGDTTPVTVDGTLTKYSVTVLGKSGAGGNVSFGIRDANAAGWGSILFTNAQVRVNTWDSTYLTTTTQPIFPGLAGRSVMYFDGANHYLKSGYGSTFTAFPLVQPEEVYLAAMQWTWTDVDTFYSGGLINTMLFNQRNASPNWRLYSGTAWDVNGYALGTWGVVRNAYKGASSYHQTNNATAITGDVGTAAGDANGFVIGANASGASLGNILVARSLICNKTNAPAEANYLAWGLKKQTGVY